LQLDVRELPQARNDLAGSSVCFHGAMRLDDLLDSEGATDCDLHRHSFDLLD
jgi:hypothetical protein